MQIFVRWAEPDREESLSLSADSATLGAVWSEVCAVAEAAWGWDLGGGLEVVVPSGEVVEDADDKRPVALEDGSFVTVREGRARWRQRFKDGELGLWDENLPNWAMSDVEVICALLANSSCHDLRHVMTRVPEEVTGNDAAMRRICSEHPHALEYADKELPLLKDDEYILSLMETDLGSGALSFAHDALIQDDDFIEAACEAVGSHEPIFAHRHDLVQDRKFMNGVYSSIGAYEMIRYTD